MATPINVRVKKGSLGAFNLTDTTNANLQGVSGPAAVGDSNTLSVFNRIEQTDLGALDTAEAITQSGLGASVLLAEQSTELAQTSIANSQRTFSDALDSVGDIHADFLDTEQDIFDSASETAQQGISASFDALNNLTSANQNAQENLFAETRVISERASDTSNSFLAGTLALVDKFLGSSETAADNVLRAQKELGDTNRALIASQEKRSNEFTTQLIIGAKTAAPFVAAIGFGYLFLKARD